MLENIFAKFKIVVWRVLAFSLRIKFKIRTPHDGIHVLFCANSRNVVFIDDRVRLLLKSINSARSFLFQKRECWDEKHIKSCDNKPCLELGNPNCCLKGRYWTDVSNRSFKNIWAASCKILHWPNLSIHFVACWCPYRKKIIYFGISK